MGSEGYSGRRRLNLKAFITSRVQIRRCNTVTSGARDGASVSIIITGSNNFSRLKINSSFTYLLNACGAKPYMFGYCRQAAIALHNFFS